MSSTTPSLVTRARLLKRRLHHALARRLAADRTVYVQSRVGEYRGYWSGAARRIGADFQPLSDGIWEVRRGDGVVRCANYVVSADDPVTLRVAGDKPLCYRLAQGCGVPVPLHAVFTLDRLRDVRAFVGEHGGRWAVKPASGSASGLGVTTHVRGWRAVREAALLASLYDPRFLVERTVAAESYRLLFLGGEMVHAVRRRGSRVAGDGRTALGDLLKNAGVPLDEATRATLDHQGLDPADVLPDGVERVVRGVPAQARSLSELRTVYDESVTGSVGPGLTEEARRVVEAVGSEFAGVDVLTNDPGRPLAETGGVFLEINTTPGIHHHYHTERERAEHPVAARVLEYLLARSASLRRCATP